MTPRVALVSMPFALAEHPPLGLGLLKAELAERGIEARIYNLNLWFARSVGTETYERLAMAQPTELTGEWIFSDALFGADGESSEAYRREFLMRETPIDPWCRVATLGEAVAAAKAQVEPFLERALREIPWHDYQIIGFTSLFQQHVGSLALAKRLKRSYPGSTVVLGGANCEGAMGDATLRAFDFVDAVCSGEGDRVFPEWVKSRLAGESSGPISGMLERRAGSAGGRAAPASEYAPPVEGLDALPYPDFDEYFEEVATLTPEVKPRLMFETSRGCWWGQKAHCTFCGLNGSSMGFRQKSAIRAQEELQWLLDRYGRQSRTVSAVDNIVPMSYFEDLLPWLEEHDLDLELFYETKANLSRAQVDLCSRAGLNHIQPGIESLSTPVLRLMKKGVSRLQNVQLLKFCRQFGVRATWNFIYGFPGEQPSHYEGLDEVVRSIAHLEPPDGWGPVRFDRFSPYFSQPEALGVRNLRPFAAYHHVYRQLTEGDRGDLAYYFEGDFDGREDVDTYTAPLVDALSDWRRNTEQYALFHTEVDHHLQVFDLRPGAEDATLTLDGALWDVYRGCDSITGVSQLRRAIKGVSERELDRAIDELEHRRLLLREGPYLLGISVPLGHSYVPSRTVRRRLVASLKAE